jgi:hypothetical protein
VELGGRVAAQRLVDQLAGEIGLEDLAGLLDLVDVHGERFHGMPCLALPRLVIVSDAPHGKRRTVEAEDSEVNRDDSSAFFPA